MKNLGLICILTFWVSFAYLLHRYPNEKSFSISKHAAADKKAYFIMAILETIYLPLFFLWVAMWFVPNTGVSTAVTYLVGLGTAALLIAAWVPDTHGWKHRVHETAANSMALLLIPTMLLLALSPSLSVVARIVSTVAFMYMVVCAVVLLITKQRLRRYLYMQAGYFFVFHAAILSATYLG